MSAANPGNKQKESVACGAGDSPLAIANFQFQILLISNRRQWAINNWESTTYSAVARSAGSQYLLALILGLAPQALRYSPLRGLVRIAMLSPFFAFN